MLGYASIFGRKITPEFFFPFFQTSLKEVKDFALGVLPLSVWFLSILFFGILWYAQRKTIVYVGKKTTYLLGGASFSLLVTLISINAQRHLILYLIYRDAQQIYYMSPLMYTVHREENMKRVHTIPPPPEQRGLYVVIIGESATNVGWGAYGYYRNTTPFISSNINNPQYTIIYNVYSAEQYTEQSVFYMLTNTNQYNDIEETNVLSLLDILKTAGFKTIWISNQSIVNINSAQVRAISCNADIMISDVGSTLTPMLYDEDLLPYIEKVLQEEDSSNGLVLFIHLYGSHIRFHHRYNREKYSIFTDAPRYGGKSQVLADNVNHYDNSIYATDDLLRRITHIVEQRDDFQMLMYVSDHGEGVYKGVPRGHPKSFPDVVQVPLYFYMGTKYMNANKERVAQLRANAWRGYTTDMLFDTFLGLVNIKTDWYTAMYDLSSPLYQYSFENLKTNSGSIDVDSLCSPRHSGNAGSID